MDLTGSDPLIAPRVIGYAIRRFREREGLTLAQFARAAGISYQYLCGIENGKENFSVGMLEKVCAALDLSLHTLVEAAYGESSAVGFARSMLSLVGVDVPVPVLNAIPRRR